MAVQSRDLRSPVRSNGGSHGSARPLVVTPPVSLNSFVYVITALLALLAIYAIMGHVVTWGRERIDDIRYGTPRTFHMDAAVGHGDSEASPSHFIAMNLDRQVLVIQIPGGDTSQTRTITGPYLVGAGEDKTPVLLSFEDVNRDGTRDMIVNVKNEAIVFLNRDGQFTQMTAEDRAQVMAGQ
ncbi:MAG: hypothetical protein Fur005_35070 [Roseiflexaceae bacterium]